MSQGAVRAGAAYEAILVDKVTGNVNKIIESLGRLEAAFKQINPAANQLNQAMGGIGAAMNQAASASTRSIDRVAKLGRTFQRLSAVASTAGQAIGQAMIHIGNQIRMIGIAATGAAGAVTFFLYRATREASRATETLNQFNQVFGPSAEAMDQWAREFAAAVGRSTTATREGLATFRSFFTGLGFGAKEANEMSKQMQRLAVDFASFRNLADEEALRRFIGGLAGQSENLLKFGINIQDAALAEHELARQLGLATNQMTQQQKAVIRYAIITEKMKEMSAEGDALRTAFEFENQIKRLGAAFETLQKRIGDVIKEGIGRDIVQALNALFKSLSNLGSEQINSIIGLTIAIGGLGVAFTLFGTALAMAGPPIIAAGAVLASFLGAIGGILAGGPIAIAGAAVAAFSTSLAGVFAYFTVREFPLRDALARLGRTFEDISSTAQLAIQGIANAIATTNYDAAWEIATLSGKIAFERLAYDIKVLLTNAIIDGVRAGFDAIKQTFADLKNLITAPGSVVFGAEVQPDPAMKRALDFLVGSALRPLTGRGRTPEEMRIREMELRLKQLVEEMKQSFEDMRASMEEARPSDEDFRPTMPGMEATGGGREFASIGSVGSMLARAVGDFAPQMGEPLDRLEKEASQQTAIQQQTYEEIKKSIPLLQNLADNELAFQ